MKNGVASPPSPASFLTVGHPLKISFLLFGRKAVYGSTLLGWKEHAYLICEWPAQWTHHADIPRDTVCMVSYLHAGRLVGYRSAISDKARLPVPVLFLAFPRMVEHMPLRKHPRVSSSEPALLMRAITHTSPTSPLSSDYAGGLVKDLSEGGCSIALPHIPSWMRPGSALRIEFELPGLGHVTNLAGIIKSATCTADTKSVGIEFQFNRLEYIEYRGWGGSVKHAIAQWTLQRKPDTPV